MDAPTQRPIAKLIERLFFATALAAGTLAMSPASAQTPLAPTVSKKPQVTPPKNDAALRTLTPAPAQMLLNPPDSDWLMWRQGAQSRVVLRRRYLGLLRYGRRKWRLR